MDEDRIQRLVRELVTSEMREAGPGSSIQQDSSNNTAPPPINACSFNPAANYGGRITQRQLRHQRTLPYVRDSRQSFTSTNTCATSRLFNKDVFLLPSPSLRKVPRSSQEPELQRLRCYVDALCFSKEMSEEQVKQKLTQKFEKLLVNSEGRPVR